ncbi:MAG: ribonuclease Y [Parcubacteria group bacterium CG10_big_fil_rev_8_21_14_0_10_38_31]|nr:MAG: ribonuclease Y [Parcubacteria group bacterium CG10_big_fil_rev_8_21_14_0_10_38_31]
MVLAGISAIMGIGLGYFLRYLIALGEKTSSETKVKQLLLDAKTKAQETLDEAKSKADVLIESAKNEEKTALTQVRKMEERIIKREEQVEKRHSSLESEAEEIKEKVKKINKIKEDIDKLEEEKRKELEKVASLTEDDAKDQLLKDIEKKYEEDLLIRIRKIETSGKEELERRAKDILSSIIQRLASSTASEVTTTSVPIPSDDIKGKIIGKEGRNIRAFEAAAGIEVIVDDTPGTVIISGFDPVRRHIAKVALESLILDGRIQPARIEEMVENARREIDKIIRDKGEQAAYEAGVFGVDPRLLSVLGRLHFRTSYGQNVLRHSIEIAHLAGMLAEELGANVVVAKKGALFHDIGKAMDHEVQGTHVEIGRRILQKFNIEEDVIKAMQAHHGEYPYETLESIIVQTADAISGARPGARRDTLENYLKRLGDLEAIANSFSGVEKSYAIQAGREIRIFVNPKDVTDLEAHKMARSIADRVENELKYPGEIKINVVRETKVIEYAR